MSLTDKEIQRVSAAARFAARNSIPIEKCPYDPGGSALDRARALLWVRVHRRTKPGSGQVSYEGGGDAQSGS